MGLIRDIKPIFNKYDLPLIDKKQDNDTVFSFVFDARNVKPWKAGQHGIFTIKHKRIPKATRPFSVASSYDEGHIMITMSVPKSPSAFKEAMTTLEPGMTLTMRGPVGPLYLKDDIPALLIAGGIGITPHRAIIHDYLTQGPKPKAPLVLLYIDSDNDYLYKDELIEWNKEDSIDIIFINNREALNKEIARFNTQYHNTGQYLISGPKAMINSVIQRLKKLGIKRKHIVKDIFYGY